MAGSSGGTKSNSDYDFYVERMSQMENTIEESVNRWVKMDKEMQDIKNLLKELTGMGTGGRGSDQMSQRVEQMSKQISELKDETKELRQTNEAVIEENKILKQQIREMEGKNEALGTRLNTTEERGEEQNVGLARLKHEQEGWVKAQEETFVDFKAVMRQQKKEQENHLEEHVIQVLRKKENVVRDVVDKKRSVIVFGSKEKVMK